LKLFLGSFANLICKNEGIFDILQLFVLSDDVYEERA